MGGCHTIPRPEPGPYRVRRMLAVGDSLTAGFSSHGGRHPYSDTLQRLLGDSWKITNCGVDGLRAVEVLRLLGGRLQSAAAASEQFDLVAILAGTNDLGAYAPAATINGHLLQMHKLAHEYGVQTIAITLPEMAYEYKDSEARGIRHAVNSRLKCFVWCTKVAPRWCCACACCCCSRGRSTLFDLGELIPNGPTNRDAKMWSDMVHLSAAGYRRFGELLHGHMVEQKLVSQLAISPLSQDGGGERREEKEEKAIGIPQREVTPIPIHPSPTEKVTS